MTFIQLNELQEVEPVDGFRARFIHSETMTFAYWTIREGAVLPEHAHPHEQVAHLLEGELELIIDGRAMLLTPGMVAVVPSDVQHSGRAVTECRVLDVFCPVREDLRDFEP